MDSDSPVLVYTKPLVSWEPITPHCLRVDFIDLLSLLVGQWSSLLLGGTPARATMWALKAASSALLHVQQLCMILASTTPSEPSSLILGRHANAVASAPPCSDQSSLVEKSSQYGN